MIRSALLLLATPGIIYAATSAQRIVSLAPHATELVIAAGGLDKLVAAVPADRKLGPAIVKLNTVGGLDREFILALNPDLIVAWASGNRSSDLAWLRGLNIPIYLSEPDNLGQISDDMLAIGRLIGTGKIAAESAKRFLKGIGQTCTDLPQQEVYVDIWDHPAMTLGGRHWLNDALSRAGLRNTFETVGRPVFSVEGEALLSRGTLPKVQLRDGSELGSSQLGRPGPQLAEAIQNLCRQRHQAEMAPR